MGVVALAVLIVACGKKGPPLPPLRPDPMPVTDVKAGQQGDHLVISYQTSRTTIDNQRLEVHDVEVLVADRSGDMAKVAQVTRVRVAPGETRTEQLPLPAAGATVRVAVRARANGARSPLSKIESFVVAAPPEAPTSVTAANDPAGVLVSWATPAPTPVATPSPTPAATVGAAPTPAVRAGTPLLPAATPTPGPSGYEVHRRGPTGVAVPITDKPIAAPPFLDQSPLTSGRWCYSVRRLASTTPLVASADSAEACVEVRDVRPPQPPTGLTLLPRDGGLELTWSPSADADVALYRIYRSPAGAEPERIGEQPAAERTFHDTTLAAGVRYRYRVTAVDTAGNESAAAPPVEGGRP
jgi:hypothetical protein